MMTAQDPAISVIHARAMRHLSQTNDDCLEFAATLEKSIPYDACDKDMLVTIVLSHRICSKTRLQHLLEQELSTIKDYEAISTAEYKTLFGYMEVYQAMLDALKRVAR